MKCWKCGREVAETSNFCGRCGAPQKINAISGTAVESTANRNTAGTEERVQRGAALVNEAAARWGDVLS